MYASVSDILKAQRCLCRACSLATSVRAMPQLVFSRVCAGAATDLRMFASSLLVDRTYYCASTHTHTHTLMCTYPPRCVPDERRGPSHADTHRIGQVSARIAYRVCVWAHPFGREIAVGLVLHDRARLRICFPAGRILCAMATYETTGVSRTAVDYSRHAVARDLGVCSTRLRDYSLCVASVFSTN